MQSSVELQNLFSYSLVPIVFSAIGLLALAIIYFVLYFHAKKAKTKPKVSKIVKRDESFYANLKNKYLYQINELETKVKSNTITIRNAYQELSEIIRKYVFDATNIQVQNYTLQEIKSLNMPSLSSLIEEYYNPEFSYEGKGDIIKSLGRTKEAIIKWN